VTEQTNIMTARQRVYLDM